MHITQGTRLIVIKQNCLDEEKNESRLENKHTQPGNLRFKNFTGKYFFHPILAHVYKNQMRSVVAKTKTRCQHCEIFSILRNKNLDPRVIRSSEADPQQLIMKLV